MPKPDPLGDLLVEIRRSLKHLYDPIYLQRSPLLPLVMRGRRVVPGQEAKALRQALLEALGDLSPGDSTPLRSERRRCYAALQGRYVDQRSDEELASDLAVSLRQLRREIRKGLEALTVLFANRYGPIERGALQQSQAESKEPSVWMPPEPNPSPFDLASELTDVERLIAPLAAECQTHLVIADLPSGIIVNLDRVIFRQVLLSLHSKTIQAYAGGKILTEVEADGERSCVLRLRCSSAHRSQGLDMPLVRPELLQALGGDLCVQAFSAQLTDIRLTLPRMRRTTVLLIDDSESLHQLFRRYLAGFPYLLYSAYSAEEGIHVARTRLPDVVVLDIMMPNRDGWEVLCTLKDDPPTRDIPVIICSVLDQKALAKSLSAAAYLTKPVTQEALLDALHQLDLESGAR